MQIVINIPEGVYKTLRKNSSADIVRQAVIEGTLLPKGHGRLIDADRTKEAIYEGFEGIQFYDGTGFDIYQDSIKCIDCVTTIIEADKESEDKE